MMNRREAVASGAGALLGIAGALGLPTAAKASEKETDAKSRNLTGIAPFGCTCRVGRLNLQMFRDMSEQEVDANFKSRVSASILWVFSVTGIQFKPETAKGLKRIWRTWPYVLRHQGDEKDLLRELLIYEQDYDLTEEERGMLQYIRTTLAALQLPEDPLEIMQREFRERATFGGTARNGAQTTHVMLDETISTISGLKALGLDWKQEQARLAQEAEYQAKGQEPLKEGMHDVAGRGGESEPDAGRS